MPNILRQYIDPVTGNYSDTPVKQHKMAFTTIHFRHPDYPDAILEYSLDEDIRSLLMNLVLPGKDQSTLNTLNNALFAYLSSVLPDSVNVGIDTADDGLCISIPDFSEYPMLQSETLAASVLSRAVAVLESLDKKSPRIS